MYQLTNVLIVLVVLTLAVSAFLTYRIGNHQKGDYENQGNVKAQESFIKNPIFLVYIIGTGLAVLYVLYIILV
ncbi:hypothetical protein [Pseudalkalibacillus caeni]|uniref:Uncharacterized protein n=1 Tax=Exobacillus caeni TaxID=2574798 RepID=A0A5R9F7M4_9BACL|nr:hypothetical protein [Pseudalkalibacillus caeni]TLS39031.1 hypothetical protein FCL54_01600 [Pseudalkalibacillus caeni]